MDEENKNEISQAEESSEEQNSKSTRKRVSLDKVLPDYRVTKLKDHLETIKAYYILSNKGDKGLKYTDFKGNVSFHEQKVSGLNKFLEAMGFIEAVKGKPGQYIPTKMLVEFQKALEFNYEDKAKAILREALMKTWFFESVRNVLQMKGKVTINELTQKLGYDSGADPKMHNTSLKILVEYLNYADIIQEEDGEFSLSNVEVSEEEKPEDNKIIEEPKGEIQNKGKGKLIVKDVAGSNIAININIPADMDENKLDGIFKKVKKYFFDSEEDESKSNE